MKNLQGKTDVSEETNKTRPPDSKDATEVVHDVVELVLQLLEKVARLHIELQA